MGSLEHHTTKSAQDVYRDEAFVLTWTDPDPIPNGNLFSLKANQTQATFADVEATQLEESLEYFHTDHLGSVVAMTKGQDFVSYDIHY